MQSPLIERCSVGGIREAFHWDVSPVDLPSSALEPNTFPLFFSFLEGVGY